MGSVILDHPHWRCTCGAIDVLLESLVLFGARSASSLTTLASGENTLVGHITSGQ